MISYLRTQYISRLTFNDFNLSLVELPLISISLTSNEKYVLKEFYNNCTPEWNGKIGSNNFVRTYSKNRKYLYRVISKCKKLGLMNSQNRVTDFGRLYLEWGFNP